MDQIIESNKIDSDQKKYRRSRLASFEASDYPTWKRVKVKDSSVPEYQPYNNQKVLWHKQRGLSIQPIFKVDISQFEERLAKRYGPSDKHRQLTEAFSNNGTVIEVQPNVSVDEPIVIKLELNSDNALLLDHHIIHAGAKSKVTCVIDYSDTGISGFVDGIINIIAEQGAIVHVITVQNLSKESTYISSALSVLERESQVRFNSIDLGSGLVVTDYSSYLEDESAISNVESIYLGDGKSKLDMGYNTYHKGRRTESEILVKGGALLDEARKVFRGNLFFEKGAKRAHGSEQEYVILLDERVQADSIPALMCDEDDVQGEHAASAGQVDANKLFYLMSRGLTEKEAKQMVIMASFAPVIERIPIEGLKERISDEVLVRLTQDLK